MASRAKLTFKPVEYAYQARFGIMPDYDFTNRLKAGEPFEKVSALINGRLAAIWAEEKALHERKETCNDWQDVSAGCPF